MTDSSGILGRIPARQQLDSQQGLLKGLLSAATAFEVCRGFRSRYAYGRAIAEDTTAAAAMASPQAHTGRPPPVVGSRPGAAVHGQAARAHYRGTSQHSASVASAAAVYDAAVENVNLAGCALAIIMGS